MWCKRQQFLFYLCFDLYRVTHFYFSSGTFTIASFRAVSDLDIGRNFEAKNPRDIPVFRITGSYTQHPGESGQLPGESARLCPCTSPLPRHEERQDWLAAGVQWLLEPLAGRGSERAEVWRRRSGATFEGLIGPDLLVQTAPVDGPRLPRSVVPWRNWTATCGTMV